MFEVAVSLYFERWINGRLLPTEMPKQTSLMDH